MSIENLHVVITGAARDCGRTLAVEFAERGAVVHLSSRDHRGAERTRDEMAARGCRNAHAYACDLGVPASIRAFAASVAERTDHVDVVVNNGCGWLEGEAIESAEDDDIVATIASGAAGTVLMVKHFLPLLRASERPDVVNMISAAALPNATGCVGHPAFYAAKGAQSAFAGILGKRLRTAGVRVISLYPPDFDNRDRLSAAWDGPRRVGDELTANSLVECIMFAIGQPRDCFICAFHFESA